MADATPPNQPYDLVIRNVFLEGGQGPVDLALSGSRIVDIGHELPGSRNDEFEGAGCLASPPFIDPHTHLDKAFLTPALNRSGTLEEAIEILRVSKGLVYGQDFDGRVDKALGWALKHGTLAVRTHVDVDSSTGTALVEAMLKAKQRWDGIIDIQIVAFPQQGLLRDPGARALIHQSMQMGADLVGGIPALEQSPRAAREHIDFVFSIAAEFKVDVDMHIDETDDPDSRTLEMLAEATMQAGWQGRVAAAHCVALAAYDDLYARHVIEMVAAAQIHVITNPTTNLVLQGRHDRQPIRRGITRVKELLAAGANVTCGQDNLRDVFYPFGQADMLEVAFVTALTAQLTGIDEIQTALDMPRGRAAALMGIGDNRLREGGPADMVLLPVNSAADALASRPPRRAVFRSGRLLFKTIEASEMLVSPRPA